MPIQIEQRMPRCLRCGKLVHERDAERIEEADGTLFCSATCRDEYAELKAEAGHLVGAAVANPGGGTRR